MPYTFSSKRVCGPYVQEIDGLDLTGAGFPGLNFVGEVSIEPDPALDNEDWVIEAAHATNADGRTYTTFSPKSENPFHRELFAAIEKTIRAEDAWCRVITDNARDHA